MYCIQYFMVLTVLVVRFNCFSKGDWTGYQFCVLDIYQYLTDVSCPQLSECQILDPFTFQEVSHEPN